MDKDSVRGQQEYLATQIARAIEIINEVAQQSNSDFHELHTVSEFDIITMKRLEAESEDLFDDCTVYKNPTGTLS